MTGATLAWRLVSPTTQAPTWSGRGGLWVLHAASESPCVLGGAPFEDPLVMWWNFVGRTHEDIAQARADWQSQGDRFGHVRGYEGVRSWLPAPELPPVRLMPRRR